MIGLLFLTMLIDNILLRWVVVVIKNLMNDVLFGLDYIDGIDYHNDYYAYEKNGIIYSSVTVVVDRPDNFLANVQFWIVQDGLTWGVNVFGGDGREYASLLSSDVQEISIHDENNISINRSLPIYTNDLLEEDNSRIVFLALFFADSLNKIFDKVSNV